MEDLMGPAADAVSVARKQLAGSSDLERALARLAASVGGATGRDAAGVVLYEDAAKRKVVSRCCWLYDSYRLLLLILMLVGGWMGGTGNTHRVLSILLQGSVSQMMNCGLLF